MRLRWLPCLILLCLGCAARSEPQGAATESPEQALCRLIEASAARRGLPVEFFTRLIWRESSFRAGAISSAGAQGIAQFMPGTASERGLEDPFDPEQAIPASAHLLADLNRRFGSLGLAAAAYNAGPTRVAGWLSGQRTLPLETQDYVLFITGRPAEDFLGEADPAVDRPPAPDKTTPKTCLQITAGLRIAAPGTSMALAAFAPWGVQLAGNFSKARALAGYARSQKLYAAILGGIRPMVIGTRLRSRGTRAFYRVRAPAASRNEASALCNRIHAAGGACIVLKS
jgi:hypothetical protein